MQHVSVPPDAPVETNRRQRAARAALAAALVASAVWILHGFLPALAWAGVLAIATWRLYGRARRRWPPGRHDLLLPALFTLGVALLFLVPLGLVAVQLGHEARGLLRWAYEVQRSGVPVPDWVRNLPSIGPQAAAWWRDNLADPAATAELLGRLDRGGLLGVGRSLGAQVLHRAVLFASALLALFFLYRDGDRLVAQALGASHRLFGPRGESVGRQVVASVHGTVDGLVLVGLGVGALLGVAYALAGVPHPALLGALTAVAAMVPFGAPAVFGIASVLLLGQGAPVAAGAVFLFGVAVVFVADHFIRPALIGGATRLPFLWVLLGILGGVESFGLLGLFVGPAVMAALILLWREWTAPSGG